MQTDPDLARLALVARFVDHGVVIYGPDGLIEWVNDAFTRMSGYDPADVIGRRRVDLIHGPAVQTEEYARLAADLAAGRATSTELVTRTRQGTPYWVSIQIQPIVEEGRVVTLVGIERDVTARRQAEVQARQNLARAQSLTQALRHEKALLSTILGTIPYLIWWKNTDLRFVACNPAYLRERGLGSQAEVVGQREDQLEVDDHWGSALLPLEQQVLDGADPVLERTFTLPGVHGRPRQLMVTLLPQHENGPATGVSGVIGIGVDITQLSELQARLGQANRLESIGQLAAGVAHEINTPIQYIADNTRFVSQTLEQLLTELAAVAAAAPRGDTASIARAVEALDLPFVREEVPSALSQSLEGLERVAEIVRALKDFSHPGTELIETDLNALVSATVQVSRNEWKYVAELECELAPDVGLIACYAGELKQVLLNLVVNAAQAIQSRVDAAGRPGRISVCTRRTDEEVLITVSDNGIGIDPQIRDRIFDPFFTTKQVGQGTGQGLALAQASVVGHHRGRLEVESTPGAGTTFLIALPLARAVEEP